MFQCTVKDLVQSLTVDSNTVSKHMSRTNVRQDVIFVHDTPRIVAVEARRPAATEVGEKNLKQPGSPGKPNALSNRTMVGKVYEVARMKIRKNVAYYKIVSTSTIDDSIRNKKKSDRHRCS